MLRTLALIAILAVSACSSSHPLASCHGPVVALNTTRWQATATDLAALDKICPEDK